MAAPKKQRGRPVKRIKLRLPDWNGPRLIELRKTQFVQDGARPSLTILRAMAQHHNSWWTEHEIERCTRRVMHRPTFRAAFYRAQLKDLVERGKNPDWDPLRVGRPGNPMWFFKITRRGLSLVALAE